MNQNELHFYNIKVLKLSKKLKKENILKLKKDYSTLDIHIAYIEFQRKGLFGESMLLEIYNTDQDLSESFETEIKIDENYNLLDLIVLDIQNTISESEDEQQKIILEDIEDRLVTTFAKNPEDFNENDSNIEASDQNNVEEKVDLEDDFYSSETSSETNTSSVYKDSEVINKQEELSENLEDTNESDISEQNTVESRLALHKDKTNLVNSKKIESKSEYLTYDYIDSVSELISKINNKLQKVKSDGSSYVVDSLSLEPVNNDFIDNLRKEYIECNFNESDVDFIYKKVEVDINNTLIKLKSKLSEIYDNISSWNNEEEQAKELNRKLSELEEQYKSDINSLKIQLQNDKQKDLSDLEIRHNEELSNLTKQHKKELVKLNQNHDSLLKEELLKRKDDYERNKDIISKEILDKYESKNIHNQNENLMIAKEDLVYQAITSLKTIDAESDKALSLMIDKYNSSLKSREEDFIKAYEMHKQELDDLARQKILSDENQRKNEEVELRKKEAEIESKKLQLDLEDTQKLSNKIEDLLKQQEQHKFDLQKQQAEFLELQNKALENEKESKKFELEKLELQKTTQSNNSIRNICIGISIISLILCTGLSMFSINQHNNLNEIKDKQAEQQSKENKLNEEIQNYSYKLNLEESNKNNLQNEKQDADKQIAELQEKLNKQSSTRD